MLRGSAQTYPQDANPSAIRALFDAEKWQAVVDSAGTGPSPSPDVNYYAGIALAQLGRLEEARIRLLAGYRQSPADARFPTELAGIAFKQKRYAEAAGWSKRSLSIDPHDAYTNDLLATTFFLVGNNEAALKYWNRSAKPQIENVEAETGLRIRPELLDRALTFSPNSQLRLEDFRASARRVEGLGIFANTRLQLAARDDGKFDVTVYAQERNGWGQNAWQGLLSTFRGAFYQTIYPEYFNLHGSAMNVTSLLRWDAEKRRLAVDVAAPLRGNPKYRYRLGIDLRNENWDIRDSFTGPSPLLGSLNLRRESASAGFTSFQSGRWDWSAGVELSHRDYRNVELGTALSPNMLLEGFQLKALARARADVWRVPERRVFVSATGSAQVARIWSDPSEVFGKFDGWLEGRWFPQLQGDDYELRVRGSAGAIAGSAPFDELYMLGLERDNSLMMRAHIGTRDGRKGSAPLGERYFVTNAEINKNVYNNGLVSVRLAPFLDTGKITDSEGGLGSRNWLWDTGVETRIRVLGVGFTFTYGKDLRSGNNAFYVTAFAP